MCAAKKKPKKAASDVAYVLLCVFTGAWRGVVFSDRGMYVTCAIDRQSYSSRRLLRPVHVRGCRFYDSGCDYHHRYLCYRVCHLTMFSMSFNIDHSNIISLKKKTTILALCVPLPPPPRRPHLRPRLRPRRHLHLPRPLRQSLD